MKQNTVLIVEPGMSGILQQPDRGTRKTRIEQAEARIEQAKTRTESAEARTEQAETRAEQTETALENLIKTPISQPETAAPETAADSLALERLTARQREILQLLARGSNTKQIADVLELSPKTIEYHRGKLMTSLKMHDLPGLVRFALRVGLIPPHG